MRRELFMKNTAPKKILFLFLMISVTASLFSCVTAGMKAGPPKNSIPVSGREMLEEVNVIAIPPFYGDTQNWKEVVYEVLFPAKRISVLPPDRVDAAIRKKIPDFASLRSQDRGSALAKTGRALGADAVMNGMFLPREDQAELVIQLISLTDGRILFWQAVDLSPRDGQIDHTAKKALITEMLTPVLEHAGTRKKPAPVTVKPYEEPKQEPVKIEPQPAPQPRPETQPRTEKKQKKSKPAPSTDNISPM
jgi:hypothetical protein